MIQFTLPPAPLYQSVKPVGVTLQDLLDHTAARTDLSAATQKSYRGAIEEVADKRNQLLKSLSADLEELEERYPPDGFDPAKWPTDAAYGLFRRRLLAAARHFHGIHQRKATLRAIEDEWTELLARITPLTEGKVGTSAWHPMKLKALRTFVLVARAHGVEPSRFTLEAAFEIDLAYGGNKRTANRTAIGYLDELRAFPELAHLLPPAPLNFSPQTGPMDLLPLPEPWERQIAAAVASVTLSGWDPVSQSHTDKHERHAHVLTSGFRTALRVGLQIGLASPEASDILRVLSDDEVICAVAGEMFARKARSKNRGLLSERTTRKYLKGIRQVLAAAGHDTTTLSRIIANNKDSRKGARDEKQMTKKNRQFCESLIAREDLRRRFLYSFRTLRDATEAILAVAAAEERDLTPRELSKVRLLGAAACFAAIEIGGAPIRVSNAMALTCVGEDAWIDIRRKSKKKPMKVTIPAEFTKNKEKIEFPIRCTAHGFRDVIHWYHDTIRPLFPHAEESPFLFPAVTSADAHLDAGWFGEEFSNFMRIYVDLPMTPHQMRHGQTSLLLNEHPTEIEVIAQRIDDTPDTLRTFYGWLDSMRLVERGQDLIAGLMK